MITVAAPCLVPSEPPVPCANARSQFLTCTAGCASPRNWRTASTTLVRPPRFAGWLLHSPPPSVLNGNLPVPEIRLPSDDEPAALALLAEAEILDLHQDGDRKAVIDRGVFDVAGLDPGLGKGRRPRPHRARIGQVDLPAHLMLGRFAGAEDLDLGPFEALCDFGAGDNDRPAAVADHAAIEPVQRVGDHRRVDDILDRDDVAQHRMRIVLRVVRGGDFDPSELFAGRPVLVHVAHCAHRVHVRSGGPVGVFERRVGRVLGGARRSSGRLALAARLAGERDQRDTCICRAQSPPRHAQHG